MRFTFVALFVALVLSPAYANPIAFNPLGIGLNVAHTVLKAPCAIFGGCYAANAKSGDSDDVEAFIKAMENLISNTSDDIEKSALEAVRDAIPDVIKGSSAVFAFHDDPTGNFYVRIADSQGNMTFVNLDSAGKLTVAFAGMLYETGITVPKAFFDAVKKNAEQNSQ